MLPRNPLEVVGTHLMEATRYAIQCPAWLRMPTCLVTTWLRVEGAGSARWPRGADTMTKGRPAAGVLSHSAAS
jgi:hypothetical protein